MKKINIAVVGFGYWARNIVRDLSDIKDCRVVAICDVNQSARKEAQEKYDVSTFKTLDEALKAKKSIDAIAIVTPPETHYKLAFKALEKRKHLFVEKPLCLYEWQAHNLLEMARIKNVKLMVGHTFCYNPSINYLKACINRGELGKIKYIEYQMANLGKYQKDNVIYDLGPHGISIILHLIGDKKIKRVKFSGLSAIKKDLIDVCTMILEWDDGFAVLNASWLYPVKTRKLVIVGDKKMAVFDDIESENKVKIYNKGVVFGVMRDKKWGRSIVRYRDDGVLIPKIKSGQPLKIELKHFIDCILRNKVPVTDGNNGLKIVSIIQSVIS